MKMVDTDLEKRFEALVSEMKRRGQAKEMLALLAGRLQEELVCDDQHRYRHSLEGIMRAVLVLLRDDLSGHDYALRHLEDGLRGLRVELGAH